MSTKPISNAIIKIKFDKQKYDFHANFITLRKIMGSSVLQRKKLLSITKWQRHQLDWIINELVLNNKMKKLPTLIDMRNKRYIITCTCNCCICECDEYIKTTQNCVCACHHDTEETISYKMVRGKE